MTPEQLKASILQYAIQGKLVEQRPEEGTGEELYQKRYNSRSANGRSRGKSCCKHGKRSRNQKYL